MRGETGGDDQGSEGGIRESVNGVNEKFTPSITKIFAFSIYNNDIDDLTTVCYNNKNDVITENVMEHFIKTVLGCNVQKCSYDLPINMPQYLLNDYSYQKYIIENIECLFVTPFEFSLAAYKKQYPKLKQITNLPIVLQLKSITQYQRKALIEEQIPFVAEGSQIYLPFLAIYLTEKYQEITEIETFTPITQLVFLYLFYHKEKITATDLADKINCTTMSVSRAYKALLDTALFHAESCGVKKYLVPSSEDGELLRSAEKYFINPIEKTVYVQKDAVLPECIASGIWALSKKTMLNAADFEKCYAVSRKMHFNIADLVPKALYLSEKGVKIEKWHYDPAVLAQDDMVDDISLILSLKDNKDERVQMELDRIRSKYEW